MDAKQEDADYARRRERWDAIQAAKMRRAIKAHKQLSAGEDERRVRDASQEPPPGWVPEPTAFGSSAGEELRRAME